MVNKKVRKYPELSALKGLIREKGTSYRKLAISLNRSISTFSDKINGYYLMDSDDIESIVKELEINPADIIKYFFPRLLRNAI